jgi:hypothetical protein
MEQRPRRTTRYGTRGLAAARMCRLGEYVSIAGKDITASDYGKLAGLAEGVGFEPTGPLQARRFSRPVP